MVALADAQFVYIQRFSGTFLKTMQKIVSQSELARAILACLPWSKEETNDEP